MKRILCIGIIASISCTACSPGFAPQKNTAGSEGPAGQPQPPNPPSADPGLKICSQLDFSGVAWPTGFQAVERRAMALALNITGSFEGSSGWENLAGNFDGQGISLGLNQQNLGQGTLQPILIAMIDTHATLATDLFSPTHLKTMTAMLNAWSERTLTQTNSLKASASPELFPDLDALSPLDIGFEPSVSIQAARNADSVAWAVATVFQFDRTFKPEWKNSLQAFASTAPYRSLQIEASTEMFERAVEYFFRLNLREIRSLLLMYDFVVQNGGFSSEHLAELKKFDFGNPKASESARLFKLLEIRLLSVRPEFRIDVDSRKRAIISGVGRVHGRTRDLQKEYCYSSTESMRDSSSAVIF
jgi:hypothetical protein